MTTTNFDLQPTPHSRRFKQPNRRKSKRRSMNWMGDPMLLQLICIGLRRWEHLGGSNGAKMKGMWGEAFAKEQWNWLKKKYPHLVRHAERERTKKGMPLDTLFTVFKDRMHKKLRWRAAKGSKERIGHYTDEHPFYVNRDAWNDSAAMYAPHLGR